MRPDRHLRHPRQAVLPELLESRRLYDATVDMKEGRITITVDAAPTTVNVFVTPDRKELRVEVDEERLYFGYRVLGIGNVWEWIPQMFDASILSDEASMPGLPNFTGAFVGMACQDMAGTAKPADFDWFSYRERAYEADPR